MDQRTQREPIVVSPPNPSTQPPHESRALGYGLLLIATIIWGINWPVAKYLLHELPPLTMRTLPGVFGALILAGFVLAKGQSLRVPRGEWGRLILYSVLVVSAWMGLMGLSLVHLPASETAILGATLPVWAAGLAWPILGEQLTWMRIVAIAMAIGGVVLLMGGDVSVSWDKVPGIAYALIAALLFALGTVLAKRRPLAMPPLAGAVWQIGLGCFPVALIGILFEHPHLGGMSHLGWSLFGFSTVFQVTIGFACWFAALERLPASIAAIGTLIVPVTGVVASAISLGEPLGIPQIGALLLTVTGVAIAARS
jgi:drug/metabolite transporter (DMT)-like permease